MVKSHQKLSIVTLTCLYIAAKYEEVVVASVYDFANISKGKYSADTILKLESRILSKLNFIKLFVFPSDFIEFYCSQSNLMLTK